MFQQRAPRFAGRIFFGAVACALFILHVSGCERAPARGEAAGASSPPSNASPTVVSLVPAATDLILGMGAGDHLVAVSNWDADRAEIARLPRVGDYRTIDWERIAALRPGVMIVQYREDKMPTGLRERAASLGTSLVNVKNNRLDDVFTTMRTIGEAIGESSKAAVAETRLRAELDAVWSRVSGRPSVRTLIARTHTGVDVVGGGNFMDDLLTIAGGQNVLAGGDNSYPTIDREMIVTLNPDVVLQVMPGATPQDVEQARHFWAGVPQVAAVQNGRVYELTDSYLLLPGYSAGKVADLFARKLHPDLAAKDGL
jgi:ABC-type Fe3+-hydroxamate transport system substrate-binding protein